MTSVNMGFKIMVISNAKEMAPKQTKWSTNLLRSGLMSEHSTVELMNTEVMVLIDPKQ